MPILTIRAVGALARAVRIPRPILERRSPVTLVSAAAAPGGPSMSPPHTTPRAESPHSVTVRAPALSVRPRVHEREHLLLWQVHGAADLVLDGEPVVLPASSACWIPAGVVHAIAVRADSVLLPLFFDAAATHSPAAGCTVLRIPEELRPLLMLSMQYQNSILSAPEGRDQLEAQVLGLIRSRSALPLPRSEPARSIAEGLRDHPADPRTAQEIAASAHLSYRTLERVFLQETGMTLHQWRIAGRMLAATRLLREGIAIPAVAARVGYANVSAFGRVFRKQVGETPRRYARHHGASI